MTWTIGARLTAWYTILVIGVLATAIVVSAVMQARVGLQRFDTDLNRQALTLEGVMRTEFNEGLDMQAAADEASIEVVAP